MFTRRMKSTLCLHHCIRGSQFTLNLTCTRPIMKKEPPSFLCGGLSWRCVCRAIHNRLQRLGVWWLTSEAGYSLRWALKNGHAKIVHLPEEDSTQINSRDFGGRTSLSLVVDDGHIQITKLIPSFIKHLRWYCTGWGYYIGWDNTAYFIAQWRGVSFRVPSP